MSLFTGLDYWPGIMVWITALKYPNCHKMPFQCRTEVNMLIQLVAYFAEVAPIACTLFLSQ